MASRASLTEAAGLRKQVDSLALNGCCGGVSPGISALADLYESTGHNAEALQMIRRGVWYWPPRGLAANLRREGRLASRVGDREGAIRAYDHYLALRSDPEPQLRAQRDSVRADLTRLKGAAGTPTPDR